MTLLRAIPTLRGLPAENTGPWLKTKKIKKQKRKLTNNKTAEEENIQQESETDELEVEQTVHDKFTRISMLKTKHKIKAVDIVCEFSNSVAKRKINAKEEKADEVLFDCKIACILHNNQIEVYFVKG